MLKTLLKNTLAILLLTISLDAFTSVTKLQYEGGISLYGKIGTADVLLEEDLDKNIYKMKVTTYSSGLVQTLTSNRVDTFISEGIIEDGVYIPNKFTKHTTKDDYKKIVTYTFDYANNIVHKNTKKEEIEYKNEFDIITLKVIQKQKLNKSDTDKEIELRPNDYLSMFLNVRKGNLTSGDIKYIDKKDTNNLFLINADLADVKKNKDIYRISAINDESLFFKKVVAHNIAFYGDAYIKKVSEDKNILD